MYKNNVEYKVMYVMLQPKMNYLVHNFFNMFLAYSIKVSFLHFKTPFCVKLYGFLN
jgi:uncharacterized membrane protein YwzB